MAQESFLRNLVIQLNNYTKAYDEGNPIISDKEWDDLYFALQQLEKETGIYLPSSPTQRIDYQVVNGLKKVTHTHPMLSLDKTKSVEELKAFLGNKKFICMGKMDGLTCALRYEDGVLVSAETRGDGIVGEDILHNAKVVPTIPKRINRKGTVEVDGEIICTYRNFENFVGEYKNPRNFASGSIRLLDAKECERRHLTFVAWDWINNPYDTLGEALCQLGALGLVTVPRWDGCETSLDNLDEIMKETRLFCYEEEGYPADGLVFKYDDVKEYAAAGRTDHHFKGGLAFKFYDEEAVSYLTKIDYDVSRTGVLTPVACFEDVEIDGTIVNRASLSNMSILRDTFHSYTPLIGTKIWVTKRNQIIPKIEKAEDQAEVLKRLQAAGTPLSICVTPTVCPDCGRDTAIKAMDSGTEVLICTNDECPGKFVNKLVHYCDMKKGMAIKGLSEKLLSRLMEVGYINSISDLYSLSQFRTNMINLDGLGEKSVDNILNAIEESKNCELWQFISALGIPLIGAVASKQLEAYFSTWSNFYNQYKQNFKYSTLPNFGYEMDKAIHDFDLTEANEIAQKLNFKKKEVKKVTQTLEGKKVCITGKLVQFKNRAMLQEAIELVGGKVVSGVTSATDYLITNDTESGSAKNVAAKKYNIPIMSEADFIENFLT